MTTDTEYWAMRHEGDDLSRTQTIVRRRATPDGPAEEVLRADGAWHGTNALMLTRLNLYEKELQPISAAEAHEFERWVQARFAGSAEA